MKKIVLITILVGIIFGCKTVDEDEQPADQIIEESNNSIDESASVSNIDTCGNRVVIQFFVNNSTRIDVDLLGETKSIVFEKNNPNPKSKDCNCGEISTSFISWDLIPQGVQTFKLTTYKDESVTEVDTVITSDLEVVEGCNRFESYHFFGFVEENPFEE